MSWKVCMYVCIYYWNVVGLRQLNDGKNEEWHQSCVFYLVDGLMDGSQNFGKGLFRAVQKPKLRMSLSESLLI